MNDHSPPDDPWAFLQPAAGSDQTQPREQDAAVRGQIRRSITAPSLKSRAVPTAVALGLMSFTAFLTQITAASQLVTAAGPQWLLAFYAAGGVGLLLMALVQFRFIDQHARLPMLRIVLCGYGAIFAIAVIMSLASPWTLLGVGLLWILAEQTNYLVPLLMWTLAGDEFNVAEGRKIFPWIATFGYGGQMLGLLTATISPWFLTGINAPLLAILILNPITCISLGIWLPRKLKNTSAARGTARSETLRKSITSPWQFVVNIRAWRSLFWGSVLTFIAGMTLFVLYLSGTRDLIGGDPAELQVIFGSVGVTACLLGWVISRIAVARILDSFGVPSTLLMLPIVTMIAASLLAAGLGRGIVLLIAVGMGLWLAQRWSIDRVARRAAMALVPDERRARVYFLLELVPVGIGLLIGAGLAAIGSVFEVSWAIAIAAGGVAGLAIWQGLGARATWDESMLSWRLRRRKTNRGIAWDTRLGEDQA